jgi:hypothetical protein
MRKLKVFAAGFGVAAGAFWYTMLTDPPKTKAALVSAPACVGAAGQLAPWFQAQASRASASAAERGLDHNLLLTWYRAARQQCAAGDSDRALANLRALEKMIVTAEKGRLTHRT